ncbi:MAG: insulinase family protein [Myxococcaceae bacterium]|nr:insulinase family protein [Myxococcaceae bacterium]
MTFQRHRAVLKNGLRLVTIETPHLHSALVAVHVRVGSRHETAATNGVSHFLEHVIFRGSERFADSLEVNGLIEDAGGSLNGMTQRDQSHYDTPIHPRHLGLGLDVLGDLVSRPRFLGVELEREIILEEMMDELDMSGRDIDVGNLAMRLMFGGHPLGLKVAGTPESVRALTEADLRAHHARFYGAANMVVSVAGPVRHEEVLPMVESAFAALGRGEAAVEMAPVLLPNGPHIELVDLDESQIDLCLSFFGPPETHPDHLPLMLVRALLDDNITSWLQRDIVETRALAYSVRAGMELFSDAGTFDIEASCSPAKAMGVIEAVLSLLDRLREKPVPREELDRVLMRRRVSLDFHSDDLATLVNCFGAPELFRAPESFEETLAAMARVSPQQIQEVARRTFSADKLHLCAVGPRVKRLKKSILADIARALPRAR